MQVSDESLENVENEVVCPACHSHYFLARSGGKQMAQYCAFCGTDLDNTSQAEDKKSSARSSLSALSHPEDIALVEKHVSTENIQFTIGPYHVLEIIGKGGMGEVFLAYDTICGRRIALKRIRTDLLEHKQLFFRFLKEARITSQLTHPSIIPIYAIHEENNLIYYTMPFVEGSTLKEIFQKTRQAEKKKEKPTTNVGSIPSLIRVLLSICQAVAYAHSKQVLHRDLKPENIIVGKYGEVLILDWGLAKVLEEKEDLLLEEASSKKTKKKGLTLLGKVVGTVAYMAPERGKGNPATPLTDIYSLGVMLYQMLTLHMPFRRGSIPEFRKTMHLEEFIDPAEIAPYRDVPKILTRICQQCLAPLPEDRYQRVEDLIRDLENYIEGRSEWFQAAKLDIYNKGDWEFQENVLIAEHVAITRNADVSDWVSLMISKISFSENIKIEAQVILGEKGHGIGFLLSIPEFAERKHLNDGYCLWLGSDQHKSTKLLRSTVEVMNAPEVFLQRHDKYRIRIEKIDNNIHFFLNDVLQFSYISHIPIAGTHMGLLSRDADFEIRDLTVFVGSQNVMVNCLAIPDAFLAHKDYAKALSEYRRIGYSFPGRAEGREAMFRAGITLLEEARNHSDSIKSKELYDLSLLEFEKLHHTPGAPLEYLGKALVYQSLLDYDEEIKCYNIACRRHPHHPLLHVLQEQIVYRMHESSRHHRLATYNLIFLVVRHLPLVGASNHSQKLFASLQKHWEVLEFIEEDTSPDSTIPFKSLLFATPLAFWLAQPYFLGEILDDLIQMPDPSPIAIANALFCIIELGSWEFAEKKIEEIIQNYPVEKLPALQKILDPLSLIFQCYHDSLENAVDALFSTTKEHWEVKDLRVLFHLLDYAIRSEQTSVVVHIGDLMQSVHLNPEQRMKIDCYRLWALLLQKDWASAEEIFHSYPLEMMSKETTPLHFLYGCWLYGTEGNEIAHIHFSGILEVSYPRSWTLATYFLNGKIGKGQRWLSKAFLWEKRQLYRQLVLFYHVANELDKVKEFQKLENQEYVKISS